MSHSVSNIYIPSRPQIDTIIAIFLLKEFGDSLFKDIKTASIKTLPKLPDNETFQSLLEKGDFVLDMGGGAYDHHGKIPEITCSELIGEALGVKEDPAIAKLIELARRDDIVGKGTVSSDALDRAFGISGLVTALNKTNPDNAQYVIETALPLFRAHYLEESKRTKELPKEFDEKVKAGKVDTFEVRQRDKKLKVVILESDNMSLPGYLRSRLGGAFDVVVQKSSTGHTNVLTRPAKRIDLRSLALVIRLEEANTAGVNLNQDPRYLSKSGKIEEASNWYYDDATNSIQNGGANPKDTIPTRIDSFIMRKLVEAGLSEQVWSPISHQ